MSHLTIETLARLVDESPTAAEQTHLARCAACRAVLDDLRAQTTELAALGALPTVEPPAHAWDRIATRVETDHLVPVHRPWPLTGIARVAAAVLLFAGGMAVGAFLTRAQSAARTDARAAAPNDDSGSAMTVAAKPEDIALARLRIAELMYTNALLDYAKITSPEPPRDAAARLATLETIVVTTRTALERAPADPLINSYYLAALAERETLLGQLRRTPEAGQWY
jgi:hypothetical protein